MTGSKRIGKVKKLDRGKVLRGGGADSDIVKERTWLDRWIRIYEGVGKIPGIESQLERMRKGREESTSGG